MGREGRCAFTKSRRLASPHSHCHSKHPDIGLAHTSQVTHPAFTHQPLQRRDACTNTLKPTQGNMADALTLCLLSHYQHQMGGWVGGGQWRGEL